MEIACDRNCTFSDPLKKSFDPHDPEAVAIGKIHGTKVRSRAMFPDLERDPYEKLLLMV